MVVFLSHQFNLEVNDMIDQHSSISIFLEKVHQIKKCARSMKSSAVLTDLSPVFPNETRWSVRKYMLKMI